MSFPYSDQARGAVQQSVTHIYRVQAAGRDLDVESATLSFDAANSPYVRLNVTARLFDDQDWLDTLDPRRGARVRVWAGYKYQSGVTEAPLVADLHLLTRDVSRPGNTLTLTASSDEIMLGRHGVTATWSPVADAQRDSWAVIQQIVRLALPSADVRKEFVRDLYAPAEPLVIRPGTDLMRTAVEIADAGPDLQIWCDGLRVWHVTESPQIGTAAAILSVGQNGTILESATELTADSFANAVQTVHTWRPEGTQSDTTVIGFAEQKDGPLGTANAPRVLRVFNRNTPIGLDRATREAEAILKRAVTRGRSADLSAVSHLWIRPDDTVSVTLPTGPQERVLVTAVEFSFPSGRMRLVTRNPADFVPNEEN